MRTYPRQPVVGVGAVVLDGSRVLLVRRGHEPLKGHWSLPGGAVEVGERLEDAIRRELREETCLDVQVGPIVEVVDRIARDADGRVRYHFVLVDYLCRPVGGELACGSDATAAEWARLDDLDRYAIAEAARAVIAKAASFARAPRKIDRNPE